MMGQQYSKDEGRKISNAYNLEEEAPPNGGSGPPRVGYCCFLSRLAPCGRCCVYLSPSWWCSSPPSSPWVVLIFPPSSLLGGATFPRRCSETALLSTPLPLLLSGAAFLLLWVVLLLVLSLVGGGLTSHLFRVVLPPPSLPHMYSWQDKNYTARFPFGV